MAEVKQEAVRDLLPVRSGNAPSAAAESRLSERVEQFQNRGFTVLREVLSAAEVAALRAQLDVRIAAKLAAPLGEVEGKPATGAELAATGAPSASVAPPPRPSSVFQDCWRRRRK